MKVMAIARQSPSRSEGILKASSCGPIAQFRSGSL
jgi:hypothetical protein